MADCMAREQREYIEAIEKDMLESTNMTEQEAIDFAFRCWQCGYVKKHKPQTNADRIRAMSDEELAEFINMVANDSIGTINAYGTKDYTEIWEERKPTLQWLKSEVKE